VAELVLIATASASASMAASASVPTSASIFSRLRLVYRQRSPVLLFLIQALNCRLCFGIIAHFHKPESLTSACVAIADDLRAFDGPELDKELLKIRARNTVAQISTIQFLAHGTSPVLGDSA
jgi:hypothetical protein